MHDFPSSLKFGLKIITEFFSTKTAFWDFHASTSTQCKWMFYSSMHTTSPSDLTLYLGIILKCAFFTLYGNSSTIMSLEEVLEVLLVFTWIYPFEKVCLSWIVAPYVTGLPWSRFCSAKLPPCSARDDCCNINKNWSGAKNFFKGWERRKKQTSASCNFAFNITSSGEAL